MTSQLPCFRCLFLRCQQQKTTENGAAVTSLKSFLFCDNFSWIFFIFFIVFLKIEDTINYFQDLLTFKGSFKGEVLLHQLQNIGKTTVYLVLPMTAPLRH